LFVIGLIVLIAGLTSLPSGWATALLGAGITAFGGFEVKLTFGRIQIEEKSIRAMQSGRNNTQINQTNPQNSPNIGTIGTAYFGTSPPTQEQTKPQVVPAKETRREPEDEQDEVEDLCSGQIHFEDFEEFQTGVRRGDRIAMQISAEHPISIQIMNSDDYDSFDSDSDDNEVYWKSPKTTSYGYSWPAKKREKVYVLVVNETNLDEWDNEEAVATVTIDVIRKKQES